MPGGGVAPLAASNDVNRIEAPVTWKAYALCGFAAFGGMFFGYDSGYINGVTGSNYFIHLIEGPDATALTSSHNSMIVSFLSAGTFFGAIVAGDIADRVGRRPTIILGCLIYMIGVAMQTASHGLGLLIAGRVVAGFGVGFVSAIIILYMSEIAPRKVRGTIVSGYQFFITVGILLASGIDQATESKNDSSSYRIPIGIQFIWGIVLGVGLFLLPESPRYLLKRDNVEKARHVLAKLRGQPADSEFIEYEMSELIAYTEYERQIAPETTVFQSYARCFTGSLWDGSSNLRRTILGTSLQMMQQWTGINFIFYFSTPFLKSTGAIKNSFLISLIFNLVNVCSTPISFWSMERIGRRPLLIWGALGMLICEFLCAIIGVTVGFNQTHLNADGDSRANNIPAVNAQISFIAIYIFFFASTWGPAAWVVIGEIFPVQIRSRGVGLSTASNWMWNTIIAVITPYMVNEDRGNLKSSVFFIWGGLCTACFVYAYFLVPETKGLSLEQVDRMLTETTPRTSAQWKPHTTYVADMGVNTEGHHGDDVKSATSREEKADITV